MAGQVPTLTQAPGATPIAGAKNYVDRTWLIFFNRLAGGASSSINILPGPPPSSPTPPDGTGIFYLDGLTPETLYLRVTSAGVITDVPLFTFP
jgi:hypothetical protein